MRGSLTAGLKVINHASPYIASLSALRAVATIRCMRLSNPNSVAIASDESFVG